MRPSPYREFRRGRGMKPCTPAWNAPVPAVVSIDAIEPSTPLKVADTGSRTTAMPFTLSFGRSMRRCQRDRIGHVEAVDPQRRLVRPRAADAQQAVAAADDGGEQRQRLQDARARAPAAAARAARSSCCRDAPSTNRRRSAPTRRLRSRRWRARARARCDRRRTAGRASSRTLRAPLRPCRWAGPERSSNVPSPPVTVFWIT